MINEIFSFIQLIILKSNYGIQDAYPCILPSQLNKNISIVSFHRESISINKGNYYFLFSLHIVIPNRNKIKGISVPLFMPGVHLSLVRKRPQATRSSRCLLSGEKWILTCCVGHNMINDVANVIIFFGWLTFKRRRNFKEAERNKFTPPNCTFQYKNVNYVIRLQTEMLTVRTRNHFHEERQLLLASRNVLFLRLNRYVGNLIRLLSVCTYYFTKPSPSVIYNSIVSCLGQSDLQVVLIIQILESDQNEWNMFSFNNLIFRLRIKLIGAFICTG